MFDDIRKQSNTSVTIELEKLEKLCQSACIVYPTVVK